MGVGKDWDVVSLFFYLLLEVYGIERDFYNFYYKEYFN